MVKALLESHSNQWDKTEIRLLIEPEDNHLIPKIYLPHAPKPDSYIWSPNKDEKYFVKLVY